jgi:hypothetical protein
MGEMKKVWVNSIFGTYKGIIIKEDKDGRLATVQLVGYPFGSYPNGKDIIVPICKLTERKGGEKNI